jgi:hypothetical protein
MPETDSDFRFEIPDDEELPISDEPPLCGGDDDFIITSDSDDDDEAWEADQDERDIE